MPPLDERAVRQIGVAKAARKIVIAKCRDNPEGNDGADEGTKIALSDASSDQRVAA